MTAIQAEQTADRALLHAGKLGHTYTIAYAVCIAQWLAVLSRDVLRVERLADENATITGEHGFPLVGAWTCCSAGQRRNGAKAPMRREEARQLLTPVYAWLTQGLDTLDLKEAKALLDALR